MDLIDTLRNLSVSRRRSLRDDDFLIDRLHHRYTVAILVLFCAVVTTNQYAGEPINCWVPAQFTGSFETYTNRLCWLQNTYYVDENQDIPDTLDDRHKTMLKYYQWIHLIILLQAVLFIIPRIVWRSLNDKCGIEIVNYVDAAIKYETVDKFAEREKLMEFLSGHINSFIHSKNSYKAGKSKFEYKLRRCLSFIFFWTGKRFGNYLIILYIFVKLMFLANVFSQLFLMTKLLGISNYHLLGIEILQRMAKGMDMISNHYFPKVTHCDFKIRELGSDHLYTVQCVLSINIFTEKIYVILWFWFVILTLMTFIDLLTFLIKNCFQTQRYLYVKKHVLIFNKLETHDQMMILNDFVSNYLKPDVILVLKILANNVNGLVVSELIKYLWESFNKQRTQELDNLRNDENRDGNYDNQENNDDDDDDNVNELTPSFPVQTNKSGLFKNLKVRKNHKPDSLGALV
ncbi:unnamed protein product [Brachionus calyciflorus]|uniref:Innexin n=1 Tax=Brachionus calyciflorus TaxID=104777 RepID=A0A813N388_9BILA|nr:unnamed protein product [Brachionus calyciflorus]